MSSGGMALLGDVANLVMGQSPPGDSYNSRGAGVPLLNGPTEFGSSHPDSTVWTCEPTRVCQAEDILFCVRGSTTGRMNWADQSYCLGRGVAGIHAKTGRDDTQFIFYSLVSELPRLLSRCAGSVFPNLSRSDLLTFPIAWPPAAERRRAARILSALDQKIELNRRMNRTLESIARAIFKSWLIDFDPVRKKMEGKMGGELGLPPSLAALFPSSLGESPLGQIPTGWVVDAVGEFIDLRYGKALRAQDRQPGSVPVYGSNGQVGWHDTPLVSGPGIVVGRKGNPGTVSWVQGDFFPIDTSFYVRPKRDTADLHYLYHALDRLGLPSLSADSAVPGLNRESASHARLLKPPLALTTAYGSFVKPLAERQAHVERESVRLTETRDALLPRLLDGTLHHAHQGRGVRCD